MYALLGALVTLLLCTAPALAATTWGVWISDPNKNETQNPPGTLPYPVALDGDSTVDEFRSFMQATGSRTVSTARFIVPYNVMAAAGPKDQAGKFTNLQNARTFSRDLVRFEAFLRDTRFSERQLTIGGCANNQYGGVPCPKGNTPLPYADPDGYGYEQAIRDIRQETQNVDNNAYGDTPGGGRSVPTHWAPYNEPDLANGLSPSIAADYFEDWKYYCSSCKVGAGELGSVPSGPKAEWINEYLGELDYYATSRDTGAPIPSLQPESINFHSYGSTPYGGSINGGTLIDLTNQWKQRLRGFPSLQGRQFWMDEGGVRLDHPSSYPANSRSRYVGPSGGLIFPCDPVTQQCPRDANNVEVAQDQQHAYNEQVAAGASLGQAGASTGAPDRIVVSHPDEQYRADSFDAGFKQGTSQERGSANRSRPGYCGLIYASYNPHDTCISLAGNVYPRGDGPNR